MLERTLLYFQPLANLRIIHIKLNGATFDVKAAPLRGQRWIRTTEGVSQQIYSLPHLATLVFARYCCLQPLFLNCDAKVSIIFETSKQNPPFLLQ